MKRVCIAAGTPLRMNDERIQPYQEALRAVGLESIVLRPGEDVPDFDGLLLSGGTDIDPDFYRTARDPRTDEPDTGRDAFELGLLSAALCTLRPVLAICRGMQLFSVYHSGTLHQHIEGHSQIGVHDAHAVIVEAGTQLASIIGAGEHVINSRHHQTVDQPGPGLVVTALSPDGIVEALEFPDHPFAIAVQWHPEDRVQTSECDRRLFQAFAAKLNA